MLRVERDTTFEQTAKDEQTFRQQQKNNKTMKTGTILLLTLLSFTTLSCKKHSDSCYDEQLYQQHKNDICTADCPGVIGCDGKTYCNECEAHRHGIKLK